MRKAVLSPVFTSFWDKFNYLPNTASLIWINLRLFKFIQLFLSIFI
ncbi:hypothetical protein [Campylobacter sp. 19-13652]|nr:hypothetical protein [Campylobacter sp. 19-13652]